MIADKILLGLGKGEAVTHDSFDATLSESTQKEARTICMAMADGPCIVPKVEGGCQSFRLRLWSISFEV